jgi:hypothetical protein
VRVFLVHGFLVQMSGRLGGGGGGGRGGGS